MDDDDDFFGAPEQGQGAQTDPLVSQEYNRLEQRYTDAGYREGITDGKLSTLQQGFDTAFAASVPLARRLGSLRGRIAALIAFLQSQITSPSPSRPSSPFLPPTSSPSVSPATALRPTASPLAAILDEAKEVSTVSARIRRDDVLPPDLERLAHEREQHGAQGGKEGDDGFELDWTADREMEGLEGALEAMGGGGGKKVDIDEVERRVQNLERRVAEA